MTETLPTCPDCGVTAGVEHEDGCDVARCLETGQQRLSCDDYSCHALAAGVDCPEGCHDCGDDVWTGKWPGEADCRRLGLMHRYVDARTGQPVTDPREQMQPHVHEETCGPDDPGAEPDLNRLMNPGGETYWDREAKQWELR